MPSAVETAKVEPKVQRSIREKVGKVHDGIIGLERQLREMPNKVADLDKRLAREEISKEAYEETLRRYSESMDGIVYDMKSKLDASGIKISLNDLREFYRLSRYDNK